MGKTSNIQWTDATWNIARGCTKVDEDCKYCYMYRDSFNNTRYNPLDVVRTKTVFNFSLKSGIHPLMSYSRLHIINMLSRRYVLAHWITC